MYEPETQLADNTPAQDGWRLLRFIADPGQPLAPGQWLHLVSSQSEAAVAVYRFHAAEAWWAALVPPDHRLADLQRGATLTIQAVRGEPLPSPDSDTLMLGVGQGIGPILALAEDAFEAPRLVCLGDASGLPVRSCPSRFVIAQLPPEIMAGVAPLESAGIAARVAIPGERPGCYDGDALGLLRTYWEGNASGSAPRSLIAAAPWRLLAPGQVDLAERFPTRHITELPEASDARPR